MSKIFARISDWSEVWALFIPLLFVVFGRKQPAVLKPVITYLWLALALNIFGDFIGDFSISLHFPKWLQSNNPVYNVHSLVRFTCFSYFFISISQPQFKTLKKVIACVFLVFVIINFTFFDDFFYFDHLSGNLLSAEAYLLLIYCLLYYLAALNDENDAAFTGPVFWIVTGLGMYLVINFFVFLFYVPLITQNMQMADRMWQFHNAAYIILCIFITRAFYATTRN